MSATKTNMQTHFGHTLDLLAPSPENIYIEEIAIGLSREARFVGQTSTKFGSHGYTVAQHTMMGVDLCDNAMERMMFFTHDMHEAYTGDITSPMGRAIATLAGKNVMGEIKNGVQGAIHEALLLPWPLSEQMTKKIHHIDMVMLATEKRDLMSHRDDAWNGTELPDVPEGFKITEVWTPDVARMNMMKMWEVLRAEFCLHQDSTVHALCA